MVMNEITELKQEMWNSLARIN